MFKGETQSTTVTSQDQARERFWTNKLKINISYVQNAKKLLTT